MAPARSPTSLSTPAAYWARTSQSSAWLDVSDLPPPSAVPALGHTSMRILGIDPLVDGAAQANPLALAIIVDKLFLEVARSRSATFTKDFRKVLAPGMAAGMEMPWNHQRTPARVQLPDQGREIWWFTEILWEKYGLVEIMSTVNGRIARPSRLLTLCNC